MIVHAFEETLDKGLQKEGEIVPMSTSGHVLSAERCPDQLELRLMYTGCGALELDHVEFNHLDIMLWIVYPINNPHEQFPLSSSE